MNLPELPALPNRNLTSGATANLLLPAATIHPGGGAGTYTLTGLPSGLSFTSATRRITGVTTATGTHNLIYSVTDNFGNGDSGTFNLTVTAPAPSGSYTYTDSSVTTGSNCYNIDGI